MITVRSVAFRKPLRSSSPLTSGLLGRRNAKRARAIRAPLLKSRQLHYMAEEAIRGGNFEYAMQHLTEVTFMRGFVYSLTATRDLYEMQRCMP